MGRLRLFVGQALQLVVASWSEVREFPLRSPQNPQGQRLVEVAEGWLQNDRKRWLGGALGGELLLALLQ